MSSVNPDTVYGLLSGFGGAAALNFVSFLLNQRDNKKKAELEAKKAQADLDEIEARRKERQQAIDEANAKLAIELRNEMRQDNAALRNESDQLRKRLVSAEARISELETSNLSLAQEKQRLSDDNKAQAAKIDNLENDVNKLQIANCELGNNVSQLQSDNTRLSQKVAQLQADNDILVGALKAANIPVPDGVQGKKGTGPLKA